MATKASDRWIVVCDAGRARFYRQSGRLGPFELLQEATHDESRAHVHDLVTDGTGRKPAGAPAGGAFVGRGGSMAFGGGGAAPRTDPKAVEAQKFAREVSGVLARGFDEHAYDKVVLVAPPQFLGLLNATLEHRVAGRVEATVPKDLTTTNERELPERIARLVA